jgi:putative hydrolase of the HAD superfamily
MISTIVFDLDDTLYEERDYYKSGFADVAKYVSNRNKAPNADIIAAALWTFNAAFDELGVTYDDAFIAELVEFFRNHRPDIELPDESREVLELLGSKYTLGLVTDGFLPAQRLKVEALGIADYFRCTIYTEELGRDQWKPSPAGFEKLLEILNVKGPECVYVGDNANKDFIAPNGLGFATIQVVRPVGIHKKPPPSPEAAASHVIQSISELLEMLNKL